jgi:predicted dehydrogenase
VGGGPTLGHGIHQIDLLLHLLGPWRTINATAVWLGSPGGVRGRVDGVGDLRERRRGYRDQQPAVAAGAE